MFRKAEKVRRPIQSAKPQLKGGQQQQALSPDQPSLATARMKDRSETQQPSTVSPLKQQDDDDDAPVKPRQNNHTSSPSPVTAAVDDSGDTAVPAE